MAAYRGTPDDGRNFWHGLGLALPLSLLIIAAIIAGIIILARVLGPILNLS
jgi:uncharacterized integral membrane protein